ncbi:MAG: DUF2892 domain-containing protein [Alphaproteobacteria bacterium]|jgi:hypothetical protein
MSCNVGGIDRIARIILGIAILGLYFVVPQYGLWLLIGLVPLLTGLFGFCPLYPIVGVNTCKK